MTLLTPRIDLCYRLKEQGIKASSTPAMADRWCSGMAEHVDGETFGDRNDTHNFP
jgi:hypothetical protein